MGKHKTIQSRGLIECGDEVEGENPRDNQHDCKPNLHRYQEQVGWEDVIVQQMCVHDIPHHSAVLELFEEMKAENHL